MRMPKIFATIAAVLMLAAVTVNAEPKATEFVEGVDWTRNVVTTTGTGIIPIGAVNSTQAQGLAAKAARADAYSRLGEIIGGVRVESTTTVANLESSVQTRVSSTIKGATILDESFLSDGGCRVTMQVPLFGAGNSLANAVIEKNFVVEPFPSPVAGVAPSEITYDALTPIDQRLNALERLPDGESPLTIVKGTSDEVSHTTVKKPVSEFAAQAKGDYTGLIVDCRGLNLRPVMSPVIKNANGTTIYGHKNIDITKLIAEGLVAYVKDTNSVARAGDNPLVVKAIRLDFAETVPVLSIADSNRVLIENHATKFLADLKVVFLFD